MQQSPQMNPMVLPSLPPTNITTEQIQKYLDENKKLIMAILENENLGKLAECAQYQALLKNNLMYLAAIADAQPQQSTPGGAMSITPQVMAPPLLHQSPMQPPQSYFMLQQPQASAMAQQVSSQFTPPRGPLQFSNPQQEQQFNQQIMPMSLINNNNGLQQNLPMHHLDTSLGSYNVVVPNDDARGGGSKQDGTNVNQSGTDGLGDSATRYGGG